MNSRDFIITNYKYFIIFAMLGVVMFWTAIVVEPTMQIAEQNKNILNATAEQNDLMIEQNQKIIENQNNSSETVKGLIQQIEDNRQEQIVHLFTVLNQSNVIGNATADLILESISNVTGLIKEAAMERSGNTSSFLGGPLIVLDGNTTTTTTNQSSNVTNSTS